MSSNDIPKAQKQIGAEPVLETSSGITLKTIVLSIFLSLGMGYINMRGALTGMAHEVHPEAPFLFPIFVAVVIIALNPLLRRFGSKFVFDSKELVFMYVWVGLSLLYMQVGLVAQFVFSLMRPQMAALQVRRLFTPFIEKIYDIAIPRGRDIVEGFWLGGQSTVPWSAWIVPTILWLMVFVAFSVLYLSISHMFKQRWLEEERLEYPMVRPYLDLVQMIDGGRTELPIWRDKMAWAGAILPLIITGSGILHTLAPAIPAVNTLWDIGNMFPLFANEPWKSGMQSWPPFWFQIHPAYISILYLTPADFLFSGWFFYIIQRLAIVYANSLGDIQQGLVFANHQRAGGFIGMGVMLIWLSRYSLIQYFRNAKDGVSRDANTILSNRVAIVSAVISFAFIVVFITYLLGVALLWTLIWVLAFVLSGLSFARIRGELALPRSSSVSMGHDYARVALDILGRDGVGPTNLAGISFFHGWNAVPTIISYGLESVTMAKDRRMSSSKILIVMLCALAFSFIAGMIMVLPSIYDVGGTNMTYHYSYSANVGFDFHLSWPHEARPLARYFMPIGALVAIFLSVMRTRFIWWPFHPMGYLVGMDMDIGLHLWSSLFLVWLIKIIITRYGGHSLYQRLKRFFYGMLVFYAVLWTSWMLIRNVILVFS